MYGCNSGIDAVAWAIFTALLCVAAYVIGVESERFYDRHRN